MGTLKGGELKMKWVRIIYVLLVGVISAVTVGFGIAAVYPEPIRPDYSKSYSLGTRIPQSCYEQTVRSDDCQRLFDKQEQQQEKSRMEEEAYRKKAAGYTRTAVFFGIVIGGFFGLSGIAILGLSKIVAVGLLLGGLLVAIFARILVGLASIGASVGATETSTIALIEFFILLIMLFCVIGVGIWKFGKETNNINPVNTVP